MNAVAGAVLVGAMAAATAQAEPVKNWFNDPFFAVRQGVRRCPMPRGPLGTEAQMRVESHERAERGTTCWLARQCEKPNAYWYDRAIADEVKRRFDASSQWRDASLWVTVQRRIVWVEGCVPPHYREGQLEALLKGVEGVEHVFANVTVRVQGKLPYRVLPPGTQILDTPAPSPSPSATTR